MSDYASAATSPSYPPAPPGIFGTKIPSAVCFAIGLLLFVLPFSELKCKMPEQKQNSGLNLNIGGNFGISFTNTGLGLAFGGDWKLNMPGMGGFFQNDQTDSWKKSIKPQKPNVYAIVALALAALSLGLSFSRNNSAAVITTVTGALSAGSLIWLMIDLKKKSKDIISQLQNSTDELNMGDYTNITLNFTPWFYVAILALLTAAFFSYKRISLVK